MKAKIKSIICLALIVITVASLAACAGRAVPSGINDDGDFVYTIVRSSSATKNEEDAFKNLRTAMKKNFGFSINITKDAVVEDFDGNFEILIGNTNREESAKAREVLLNNRVNNSFDFIVKVIDDKICINAVSDEVIVTAVDWFIHTYCQNLESWSLLKSNYEFIYEHSVTAVSHSVAGRDLGTFTVVLPQKTSIMVGIATDEYVDYFTKMGYVIKEHDDVDKEEEYEILIGDTTRKESVNTKVEGDNYVIKVVGKKLVVKGGTHLATWRGVKALNEQLGKGETINFSDGYTLNGKYDANEKGTYTLNWYDEFEGSTIDFNKWSDYGNQAEKKPTDSALGGKIYNTNVYNDCMYKGSDMPAKLIYQSDGYIHLGTKRVNDVDFIGSAISTWWTMIYRYGAIDIFIDMAENPATASLWLNGANVGTKSFIERFGNLERPCMLEVDILENFGNDNMFASNIHRWWSDYYPDGTYKASGHSSTMTTDPQYQPGASNSKRLEYNTEKYGDNMTDGFHMISCYWDDKCMKFAFDGKVFCTYDYTDHVGTNVCALMDYFIASTNMGSPTYGPTYQKDEHKDFYETQIDYIRIYQTDAVNSQMLTAWPQKQSSGELKIKYPENPLGGSY
ncbi:MAG: hypothetical protein E7565_04940 [Ruminococcaceae bacterium]|nr:hypothetical protein [Oscillospiraceae bacterium]